VNYCKPCNRYGTGGCQKCEGRLLSGDKFPYRVYSPQVFVRCHHCWNLSPLCQCNARSFKHFLRPHYTPYDAVFSPELIESYREWLREM